LLKKYIINKSNFDGSLSFFSRSLAEEKKASFRDNSFLNFTPPIQEEQTRRKIKERDGRETLGGIKREREGKRASLKEHKKNTGKEPAS
jgi:hypothetical protein